jgi:hypothetical protein
MTDIRKAVIEDGKVGNVIVASEDFQPDGMLLVSSDAAQIGDLYEDGKFTSPPPPPITRAQVDAERDRRTATGFVFNGKAFQLDDRSIGRITAMGADARFAIAAGAEEGDYLWADPTSPFGFIATDNTVMLMDAQTMAEFANAAKLWVSRHTFAGLKLKSQSPVPVDFTDDSHWPKGA